MTAEEVANLLIGMGLHDPPMGPPATAAGVTRLPGGMLTVSIPSPFADGEFESVTFPESLVGKPQLAVLDFFGL